MKNHGLPLRCVAKNGKLAIAVGVDVLRFAAEHHPYFWDGAKGIETPNIKIMDMPIFANEVALAIIDEDEDGSTLLSRMLDEAIKRAVENGCEGVEHEKGR